jgi:hypothetical protein
MGDGLVVGVLLPSSPLGYAFQGGYEPAGHSGVVTGRAGRDILSIDDKPAAAVYNDWIGGRIDAQLAHGGVVMAETTMFPLATDAGRVDGVSHYRLIHPEMVTATGGLRTFCNLEIGARVYAMKGDRRRLIDRAGRVAEQAAQMLATDRSRVAGALMVYCGGCKMAIGDDIERVSVAVAEKLGDAPFIGCFTFGEQGRVLDRNVHGNLMISAVVFSQ